MYTGVKREFVFYHIIIDGEVYSSLRYENKNLSSTIRDKLSSILYSSEVSVREVIDLLSNGNYKRAQVIRIEANGKNYFQNGIKRKSEIIWSFDK
ncbi:hypothetical protein [Halobacteriovorax marinus]|uniref:hypothetical protein n=1 Tax=Halobacteriovorax marinus TaxID=97084 RepID=UPI003A8F7BF7